MKAAKNPYLVAGDTPLAMCVLVPFVIGTVALVGWVTGVGQLKSVLPGAVQMKANTAVALIASGLALWMVTRQRDVRSVVTGRGLGLLVSVLGLATLLQYVFGWRLGIDEVLFEDRAVAFNAIRGRMAPSSAAAFAAFGVALFLMPLPRWKIVALAGALVMLVMGGIAAIGYGWNASEITTDAVLPPVALNTAIAFVFLAGGALLSLSGALRKTAAAAAEGAVPAEPLKWGSVEGLILVGFIASFLLLVIGGGLSYRASVVFAESARLVARTQEVRATLSSLQKNLLYAGWLQRNYLITGLQQELEMFREPLDRLGTDRRLLDELVIDKAQKQMLLMLGPMLDREQRAMNQLILLFQQQGFAAAKQQIDSVAGLTSMRGILGVISAMEIAEDELLLAREADTTRFQQSMLGSMLLTLIAAAALFAILFHGIRRQMHARRVAEQSLVSASQLADSSRREADAANRAKSSFLAAMSHEIRTPMNGVLGVLELLSLTPLQCDQQSTLTIARDSGRSLLRIVDDILDFSKIEAQRLELNPVPASIADLARRICDIHRGKASSQGLLLQCHVDPRISVCLHFDPLRVEQILNNLVSNAIKFTAQGSVDLSVEREGESGNSDLLRIEVRDTGIGISAENLERLFQPYMQADGSITTRYGGTGLGLVICRSLAELMGGTVAIGSEAGKGTTVTVSLAFPRGKADDIGPSQARGSRQELDRLMAGRRMPPTVEQAEAEGTLLLIVDDHPTNRMVLRRQVNSLGYAAETENDGLAAMTAWKTGRFGAVIADCNMPVMTGYEMARNIRQAERKNGQARIPILACTANALESEAAICLESGMDDCLVKPLQLLQLAQRLDHWLPLPQQQLLIDPERLTEITMGDRVMEAQLMAEFQHINAEDCAQLRRSVATGDLASTMHYAHRITGACRMIGSVELAAAAKLVESASAEGNAAQASEAMTQFEVQLERLDRFISTQRNIGIPVSTSFGETLHNNAESFNA